VEISVPKSRLDFDLSSLRAGDEIWNARNCLGFCAYVHARRTVFEGVNGDRLPKPDLGTEVGIGTTPFTAERSPNDENGRMVSFAVVTFPGSLRTLHMILWFFGFRIC
jgi:hypothetical protein